MKQLHFKTSKGEFLLVERNEESFKGFPNGLYEIFGNLGQLTEEQAKEVVGFGHYCPHNYTYHKGYWDVGTNTFKEHNTALQSLHAILKSLDVHFQNPLGDKQPQRINGGIGGISRKADEENKKDINDWQQAQSKVWDKENTYLFKKI